MTSRNELLRKNLHIVYQERPDLLFHGWHHVSFVARKAAEFAKELAVDVSLLEATGLVHDLNYLVDVKSSTDAGKELRQQHLSAAGFTDAEVMKIEGIIREASTERRTADISNEAKALSDADTLFKVVPIGPVVLSARYIAETKVDMKQWAERIIRDQQPLLDQGICFYTETARKKYLQWAELNLKLVSMIHESLDDPDVSMLLQECQELGYI